MSLPLLIVDDSGFARKQVIRALPKDWPVEISQAGNGIEALEKIEQGLGDVVLLDLTMPVMDGFEFLTHFNALQMDNPPQIIVFSGMDLDDTLRGTLEGMGLEILDKNDSGLEKRLQALSAQIA